MLADKEALFDRLVGRWRDWRNVSFGVMLCDRTRTRIGYSRDHRPDGAQGVIAQVVKLRLDLPAQPAPKITADTPHPQTLA